MALPAVPRYIMPPGYLEYSSVGRDPMEGVRAYKSSEEGQIEGEEAREREARGLEPNVEPLLAANKEVLIWDSNGNRVGEMPSARRAIKGPILKNMQLVEDLFLEGFGRRPVFDAQGNQTMNVVLDYQHSLPTEKTSYVAWYPNRRFVGFGREVPGNIRQDSLFQDPTIIGHEFGHAFVRHHANGGNGLEYQGQSGAIDESFADICAASANNYRQGINANSPDFDWRIGVIYREGHQSVGLNGQVGTLNRTHALRSIAKPGEASPIDFQRRRDNHEPIDRSTRYDQLPDDEDHGGVHKNCGIPSRAFYLAATEMQGTPWSKLGRIWVEALVRSSSNVTFPQFAELTCNIARQRFGSNEQNCLLKAWSLVEVYPEDERSRQWYAHYRRPVENLRASLIGHGIGYAATMAGYAALGLTAGPVIAGIAYTPQTVAAVYASLAVAEPVIAEAALRITPRLSNLRRRFSPY